MPLFSKVDLRTASYKASKQQNERELRSLSESFSMSTQFDIFLSHSFLDATEILGLKTIFEDLHYSVYIDWIVDHQLDRSAVNASTANTLRTRMRHSKALIFATSKNQSNSKWMPWELGYFDGFKGKAAILPVVETTNESSFTGQEYLGLYPYISKGTTSASILWVEGQGTSRLFSSWMLS